MKKRLFLITFSAVFILIGCTGHGLPQPFQRKPWTYLMGGDQVGRDQLMNRLLVAELKMPITGKNKNEVLNLLGQPQDMRVRERNISEDWYFIYYKNHIAYSPTNHLPIKDKEAEFVVRFDHDEVTEVIESV